MTRFFDTACAGRLGMTATRSPARLAAPMPVVA